MKFEFYRQDINYDIDEVQTNEGRISAEVYVWLKQDGKIVYHDFLRINVDKRGYDVDKHGNKRISQRAKSVFLRKYCDGYTRKHYRKDCDEISSERGPVFAKK